LTEPATSLVERLAARRGEIEGAALTRVQAISDPTRGQDPEYVAGLREAVAAGVDYALAAVTAPSRRRPPAVAVPAPLLAQARYAARSAVPLDTVHIYFSFGPFKGDGNDGFGLK
jgi:hypothetical protein